MMKKQIILQIVVLLLLSCSGNKDSEKDVKSQGGNEIELNVQTRGSETVPSEKPPVQENPITDKKYFLSGRTELLSLSSPGFISAEGFTIGEVFVEKISTAAERDIVETSRLFLESFGSDQMTQFIEPSHRSEIADYYNYYIYKKIVISDYIFGKPIIRKDESQIELILLPEYIHVYLYFSQRNGKWLINGFEADLRSEKGAEGIEKWAPSINPATMGNF